MEYNSSSVTYPSDNCNIFKQIVQKNNKLNTNALLVVKILEIFKEKPENLETDLADLLGYETEELEIISEFVKNKNEICELINLAKIAKDNSNTGYKKKKIKNNGNNGIFMDEENAMKENIDILITLGFDDNFLKNLRYNSGIKNFDQIIEPKINNNIKSDINSNILNNISDNFYDEEEPNPRKKIFIEGGYDIREEYEKENFDVTEDDFQEGVLYEVNSKNKIENHIDLVPVTKLPKLFRNIFNFKVFNQIQSTVFDKAFNSPENLLIAAPTGAGKTNIALLTMLREIERELKSKDNYSPDMPLNLLPKKWSLKLLYLVPLKALANEIVDKFTNIFKNFNLKVSEFSGDVELSKKQIEETNIFIGIPEKWDLFTRKRDEIFNTLKLMIIDEVHLLNEDRGRVLECVVARTFRKADLLQRGIRIVGLSATLPNFKDVATFLGVDKGLFYFDSSYRSTPLKMKFFGLRDQRYENELVYKEIKKYLTADKQVLVFVHSRKETMKFAKELIRLAEENQELTLFRYDDDQYMEKTSMDREYKKKLRDFEKFENKVLREVTPYGVGFHNAGLVRKDKNNVENLFRKRAIKVLVSTSTLAWGVNLPAYAVIIKGTQYYDAKKGSKVDIGVLDIQQMFGRAGRPQYDDKGEGVIVTDIKKVEHYLRLMQNKIDIESSLQNFLPDALNAEVATGNVISLDDAISWIKLTYLSVRVMGKNKNFNIKQITGLINKAFDILNNEKLIRFLKHRGLVHATELGRIASNYYIDHGTIYYFAEKLRDNMMEDEFIDVFCGSSEFQNMKIYEDEKVELEELAIDVGLLSHNSVKKKTLSDIPKQKIMLYLYFNQKRYEFRNSSLHMDLAYIADNSPRILRAMVEICLHKHLINTTLLAINILKSVYRRVSPNSCVLRQFTYFSLSQKKKNKRGHEIEEVNNDFTVTASECNSLEKAGYFELWKILEEDVSILKSIIRRNKDDAIRIKNIAGKIPRFEIKVEAKPMIRTILNITVELKPKFSWMKRFHGTAEPFWLIVDNQKEIIHYESFIITPKENDNHKLFLKDTTFSFCVPFDVEPGKNAGRLEKVYNIRILSERWLGSSVSYSLILNEIEVPSDDDVKTELLDLYPLPLQALKNVQYENLFKKNFKYFNPIQTQIFYSAYNSDQNLLVGAPTGSGKTTIAELAILRMFNTSPISSFPQKAVYIAPLKSLAKERVRDWKEKFEKGLGKYVLELSGESTPDPRKLEQASIIVATPEKWDGISRNWENKEYVKLVALLIMDEIHLLGLERGPIIEVIVSRSRFISEKTQRNVRFVGLSTALANSYDVAEWLGIDCKGNKKLPPGLFNFKPAVRPCPVTIHIEGFSEKHYCPRMSSMNKPCFSAIQNFSAGKPVLVFVSSRRQTKLTAQELLNMIKTESGGLVEEQFLGCNNDEIEGYMMCVKDEHLKHFIEHGIGIHHAGLTEDDRKIVEELFVSGKIKILIATSTLAWGVNFPAHLVVIKGTEYYNAKLCTYVDMPITDILQMIGRAGRPQFDTEGVACLYVKQEKKNFYKKFLYESFPLESSLHKVLHDHLNAEINCERISDKNMCMEYIKFTYFYKRLVKNPSYYGINGEVNAQIFNEYIENLINSILSTLENSSCIQVTDSGEVLPTEIGKLASTYYITHRTARIFSEQIKKNMLISELLDTLSNAREYEEVPVRHNEDNVNRELAINIGEKTDMNFNSPYVKTYLLLKGHLKRIKMPMSDYDTDLKLVLDNCIRILLFMVDIIHVKKIGISSLLNCLTLIQLISQGVYISDSSLKCLPYLNLNHIRMIIKHGKIIHLAEICEKYYDYLVNNNGNYYKSISNIKEFLIKTCKIYETPNDIDDEEEEDTKITEDKLNKIVDIISKLPIINVKYRISAVDNQSTPLPSIPLTPNCDALLTLNIENVYNRFNDLDDKIDNDNNFNNKNYNDNINEKNNNNNIPPALTNLIVYSKFPKTKRCRWFIVLGEENSDEILLFKKISFTSKKKMNFDFNIPEKGENTKLKLYIISDSYFGLDQEYIIDLKIINDKIKEKYGLIEVKPKKDEQNEIEDDNTNNDSNNVINSINDNENIQDKKNDNDYVDKISDHEDYEFY